MEEHIHFSPMGINTACNCKSADIINLEKVKKDKYKIIEKIKSIESDLEILMEQISVLIHYIKEE